jgi:hypothetical protein
MKKLNPRKSKRALWVPTLLGLTAVAVHCGRAPQEASAPVAVTAAPLVPPTPVCAPTAPARPDNIDPITHSYLTPYARQQLTLGADGRPWNPEWDAIIMAAIPADMLSRDVPKDVTQACPRFFELTPEQKKLFWAYFFQCVSVAESGLSPVSYMRENDWSEVTGQYNYSQGLLQLSYGDKGGHGCAFDWTGDKKLLTINANHTISGLSNAKLSINDPRNNLECGVKVLHHQLLDARPGNTAPHSLFTHYDARYRGGYYWSTLNARDPKLFPKPNGYDTVMMQLKYGVPTFCGLLP